MSRSISFGCVVLASALVLGAAASGQQPNPRPGRTPNGLLQASNPFFGGGNLFGVPGYEMLQTDSVEKELGLTDEQKDKLKELRQKTVEARRSEPRIDFAKLRDADPEERQKAMKELTDRAAKRTEEAKKQLAEILTPKQLEQLKDMAFRQWASFRLYMPQLLQGIELTDDQNQQLQTIREELQNKMTQLQRENLEKALGVLTPDQVKKLKELYDKRPAGAALPIGRSPTPQRPRSE